MALFRNPCHVALSRDPWDPATNPKHFGVKNHSRNDRSAKSIPSKIAIPESWHLWRTLIWREGGRLALRGRGCVKTGIWDLNSSMRPDGSPLSTTQKPATRHVRFVRPRAGATDRWRQASSKQRSRHRGSCLGRRNFHRVTSIDLLVRVWRGHGTPRELSK